MLLVNVYEAKTQLSRLIERALDGEEVVVAKAGHPLVRIVPFKAADEPRRPGGATVWMSDDFDAPLGGEFDQAFRGDGA